MFHHKLRKVDSTRLLAELAGGTESGIATLPQNLTINGITVAPMLRYEGRHATASGWSAVVGSGLTLSDVGANVQLNRPVPTLSTLDRAVKFNAGDTYDAIDTTEGDVGTNDFVFEIILWKMDPAARGLLGKYNGAIGWVLRNSGANSTMSLIFADGTGIVSFATAAYTDSFLHGMCFVNRDEASVNGARWVINGGVTSGGDPTSRPGSLTTPAGLKIGNYPGQVATTSQIALVGAWAYPNWHRAGAAAVTEWVDVANARFAHVAGVMSNFGVPNFALQRNSAATYPKRTYGEAVRMLPVGNRWPRVCSARDLDTDRDVNGVVSNAFVSSEDFTDASWTPQQCSVVSGTGVYDHTGDIEMHGLIADATAGEHALTSDVTASNAWRHLMIAEVAPGDKTAVRFRSVDNTAADVWQQFDLTGDGTLGLHTSNVIYADIIKRTNDRYLCWMVYLGGVAPHTHAFVPVQSAYVDDTAYTGDNVTVDLYLTAAQHDYSESTEGRQYFSSYVRTVGVERTVGKLGVGAWQESSHTNQIVWSEDLSQAAWIPTNASIAGSAVTAPDDLTTAYALVEDATAASTHLVHISANGVNIGLPYVYGVFAKAVNRDWIRLENSSAPTSGAYFDVRRGIPGSHTGATTVSGVYDVGDGWFYCWFGFVANATSGTLFRAYVATTDGNVIFDGNSLPAVYLWGAMVTQTSGPVSYIRTAGGMVTRLADRLVYQNLTFPAAYTMAADVLMPNATLPSSYVAMISAGSATANRAILTQQASGTPLLLVTSSSVTQASIGGVSDVSDGKWHEVRGVYQADDFRLYLDGDQEGATDSSGAMPVGVNEIEVGAAGGGTLQLNGLVRIRLFNRATLKKPSEF